MSALRFRHLELQNWRNFTSVDIDLAARAFFVGPNASGKSNLLDVFRFLHDIVAVGGGFAEAVRRRGGIGDLRCLAARSEPNLKLRVIIGTDDAPELWSYELLFGDVKKNRGIPVVVSEIVKKNGVPVLNRPDHSDKSDKERLRQTALEQTNSNKEFREVSEFFKTVDYLHVVPQLIREPSRWASGNDKFGSDLLEKINGSPEKQRKNRFEILNAALKIAVPQLCNLDFDKDLKGVPHLKAKYTHWRPQGKWQNEESFSDGTLRLIGLLWALSEKGGPILIEEPELSLHSAVVSQIPGMIARAQKRSGRQALITTHSAELLNYPGIGLDEVHLLEPGENGTMVRTMTSMQEVIDLVRGGIPIGEAVIPRASPKRPEQLTLLDL